MCRYGCHFDSKLSYQTDNNKASIGLRGAPIRKSWKRFGSNECFRNRKDQRKVFFFFCLLSALHCSALLNTAAIEVSPLFLYRAFETGRSSWSNTHLIPMTATRPSKSYVLHSTKNLVATFIAMVWLCLPFRFSCSAVRSSVNWITRIYLVIVVSVKKTSKNFFGSFKKWSGERCSLETSWDDLLRALSAEVPCSMIELLYMLIHTHWILK